jgi:uncharacterized protein (TIGR03437 family)
VHALAILICSAVLFAEGPIRFVSVSSASFQGESFAPESLVTAFGASLSRTTAVAAPGSAPVTLAGVSVDVVDSRMQTRSAGLLYVSPGQLNYLLPADLSAGAATATVRWGNDIVAAGVIQVSRIAPAIFTANNSGAGLAAAITVTRGPGAAAITTNVFDCTTNAPRCKPEPIQLSDGVEVYLELYGTGIRGRSELGSIQVFAGDIPLEVLYAGPQTQFPGLDQVNIRLPLSARNVGLRPITITIDGILSNAVFAQFGGIGTAPEIGVRFDPASVEIGPFPSDFLTSPDSSQKTGLRVNLPLPDCGLQRSTCDTYRLLNQLDGFNPQPRIAVQFTGPVDTNSLRTGIYILWLPPLTSDEKGLNQAGHITRINRISYDSITKTLYGKPDESLDQHRRYAIVVTDSVRDALGNQLVSTDAFRSCLGAPKEEYCRQLSVAEPTVAAFFPGGKILALSIFTTLSATAWLEGARVAAQYVAPEVKRVAMVRLRDFTAGTLKLQTSTNPGTFEDLIVPVSVILSGGADRLFFGSYTAPDFLDSQQTIAVQPTDSGLIVPAAARAIPFQAFVPESPKPAAGYPVIIFGHGLSDSSFGAPTLVAGTFTRQGFATLGINAVGHGSGPLTYISLTNATGQTTTVPLPGRGVDLNNDGKIESGEGCLLTSGIAWRDCLRQTSIDLVQLVHTVRLGLDLDGDGTVDLDPKRVYFAGQSFGALYGTLFAAVEPDVRAAAFNVGGGSVIDIAIFSKPNAFGIQPAYRDRPVKVNSDPARSDAETYVELIDWLQAIGDPISTAPHLTRSPLTGVPEKRVLFQFAKGDRTIPNPASSNLSRQAGAKASTVIYRHDIARSASPGISQNPHTFLTDISSAAAFAVAQAAQSQISSFLQSDGTTIPDANNEFLNMFFLGNRVFEWPANLPEDLGY